MLVMVRRGRYLDREDRRLLHPDPGLTPPDRRDQHHGGHQASVTLLQKYAQSDGWSFTSLSGFCLLLAMTSLLEGVTSNCELCHKPGWRCHGATASVTLVRVLQCVTCHA